MFYKVDLGIAIQTRPTVCCKSCTAILLGFVQSVEKKMRQGRMNESGWLLRRKRGWIGRFCTHVFRHRVIDTESLASREIHGKPGETKPRKELLAITTASKLWDYSRGGVNLYTCVDVNNSRASVRDTEDSCCGRSKYI